MEDEKGQKLNFVMKIENAQDWEKLRGMLENGLNVDETGMIHVHWGKKAVPHHNLSQDTCLRWIDFLQSQIEESNRVHEWARFYIDGKDKKIEWLEEKLRERTPRKRGVERSLEEHWTEMARLKEELEAANMEIQEWKSGVRKTDESVDWMKKATELEGVLERKEAEIAYRQKKHKEETNGLSRLLKQWQDECSNLKKRLRAEIEEDEPSFRGRSFSDLLEPDKEHAEKLFPNIASKESEDPEGLAGWGNEVTSWGPTEEEKESEE